MTDAHVSRRTVLRASGIGAAGVAGLTVLAACGSDAAAGGATTTAPNSAGPATSSGAAASVSSAASSAPSSSGDQGGDDGAVIAAVADIPVGGSLTARINGKPALLSQPTKGKVKAFDSTCTHQGCTVGAGPGPTMNCPCHGSKYDLSSGAPVAGPAPKPLAPIAVKVRDGKVFAG